MSDVTGCKSHDVESDVITLRHAVAELVEAMPEVRGFDIRWGHWAALWPWGLLSL
jgi:hypothetical protein